MSPAQVFGNNWRNKHFTEAKPDTPGTPGRSELDILNYAFTGLEAQTKI